MEYKKLHTPSTCSYSMHEDTASMYWKLLDVNSGKVLDLGSGMGGFGKAKPENISLYGVDRDLSISANSHGYEDVVNMDIGSTVLPFDDDSFDAILARDILEHLDNPSDFIKTFSVFFKFIYIELPDFDKNYLNHYRKDFDMPLIYTDSDHVTEFDRFDLKAIIYVYLINYF